MPCLRQQALQTSAATASLDVAHKTYIVQILPVLRITAPTLPSLVARPNFKRFLIHSNVAVAIFNSNDLTKAVMALRSKGWVDLYFVSGMESCSFRLTLSFSRGVPFARVSADDNGGPLLLSAFGR